MNNPNGNLVHQEIHSLIAKGWSDFPTVDNALHVSKQMSDREISFPHEKYDISVGNQEATGIWAKWRAKQVLRKLQQHGHKLIWEVGSGHGNVALHLIKQEIEVIGIEPLFNGAVITAQNGIRTYLGTLESLNLPPNSISAIGAFDVIEHIEAPGILLSEIYRVLKPGGLFLVSVPAHKWLFSDFDSSIGHFRRYSKKDLNQVLSNAGFQIASTEFLFSVLVLPSLILRKLPTLFGRKRNVKETMESCGNQGKILKALEPLVVSFLWTESFIHLPFGLSLLNVSQKPTK